MAMSIDTFRIQSIVNRYLTAILQPLSFCKYNKGVRALFVPGNGCRNYPLTAFLSSIWHCLMVIGRTFYGHCLETGMFRYIY